MLLTNEALLCAQTIIVMTTTIAMRRLGSHALVSWLCLQAVLANLLVLKAVRLFGLEVTASDAFMIGSLYTLNLLREDYGARSARNAVRTSFSLLLSTLLIFACHCAFIASDGDQMGPVYDQLLGNIVPIMAWSGIVFTITQVIDTVLFGILKYSMPKQHLAWRLFLSIAVTQVIDTALFTALALDGWMSQFWDVFIWSYAIKVGMTLCLSATAVLKQNSSTASEPIRHVQI